MEVFCYGGRAFFAGQHISFSAAELTTQLATRQNAGVTWASWKGG